MRKFAGNLFLLGFLTIFISACGSDENENQSEEDVEANTDTEQTETAESDNELIVGYSAQPDTLDPHRNPATATRDIARHMFETLVTVNSDYEVVPMLAESYEESEDGETITFHLREGVLFHNGKEMIAEDVVASMEKWAVESTAGLANLENATFTATDDYTVDLELEEPSSVIMHVLAEIGQFAAIMPKEVVENTDAAGITEFIGTGPFEFVEWATDQHVHLKRYEDYQSVDAPADGLSGEKNPQISDLYITFVPDASTRLNGLQTGEYDLISDVPYDNADQLEEDPNMTTHVTPSAMEILVFNEREGLFTDVTMRQAVNAGLDKEAIMRGAFVDDEYFTLDAGLMLEDQVDWYTDAGEELYNQNDQEQAEQLLEEAGYDGEEMVLLTTRDYDHHYNTSVIAQQQLEQLGMNVSLNVIDWAAFQEVMMDPANYDMLVSSFATRMIPHQYPTLDHRSEWAGWTSNTEYAELLDSIKAQETQDEALAVFTELQELFYEDLPMVNLGKFYKITAAHSDVEGFEELVGPIFWNTSISE